MIASFDGQRVRIPNGYKYNEQTDFYMDGHGVEYALVRYGGKAGTICLETVYSRHTRTIALEKMKEGIKNDI